MNKEFPEFKKEMDKINVPMDKLDSIISNTVKMNKPRVSRVKKYMIYSSSAAMLGIGLLAGSAFVSPTMAKVVSNIPVIGSIFNEIGDKGLQTASIEGLTQQVNQTVKNKGISLSINEVLYDGTRLSLAYTHESLLALGDLERPVIKINGKEINFASSNKGALESPSKYNGILEIMPTEELPAGFDMSITFDSVGVIPGKWAYKFPVELSNEVEVVRPNISTDLLGAKLTIDAIKSGPAGLDLHASIKNSFDKKRFDPNSISFQIFDEKGQALDSLNSMGSGESNDGIEVTKVKNLFEPIKEGTKNLTIIPYIAWSDINSVEVSRVLNKESLPLTLDKGDLGKIIISKITESKDEITVEYNVESNYLHDQHIYFNRIWLTDGKGDSLHLDQHPSAELVENNVFRQTFKKSDEMSIHTEKLTESVMFEAIKITLP
ncbi:DUF4179 domain-containing protein [Bacillus sp. 31A1R]|uniref:DUF4179 domain-containing protein n=1 Tax=Robertmurraya mangrovi TaxID=3098077 RepID=A0ABU5IWT0_9BACI|nr:DUF4179 domain-containing protein [Bacillus sp. 31A1R]MDZ5471592.1 DUF4179 domain-containing protein [Bacillus sp. 31A1R]